MPLTGNNIIVTPNMGITSSLLVKPIIEQIIDRGISEITYPLIEQPVITKRMVGSYGSPKAGLAFLSSLLDGIVAYWSLNESSGVLNDTIGSIDSTSQVNVTYGVAAKVGTGTQIAATTGNGIGFGFQSALSLQTMSVSCWANWTSGAYAISNADNNADRNGWALLRNGSTIGFQIDSGSGIQTINSVSTLNLSTWYHIVCSFNGSTVSMYVNGVKEVNNTAQTTIPAYTTAAFNLMTGGDNIGTKLFPMAGILNQVIVWRRVITTEEVEYLYNANIGRAYPF